MANTYTSLHYHIIFSTKNRVRCIKAEIEERVWAYLGGVARKHGMSALQVGGFEDHVHALVITPPTLSPSRAAQFLIGDSSRWIHEEFPTLRGLAWQDGYGAFTVSKSNLLEVIRYIQHQREHHRKRTSRKSTVNFYRGMGLSMMSDTSGVDSGVADATRATKRTFPGLERPG